MATDDQQILVAGTASAPTHLTIPGNGQIQPKAVFAHFNGASAATAFVPALKVISDGGQTVAICPCPTTVAAAGSADVSWFPHVAFTEEAEGGAGVSVEREFVVASAGVPTIFSTVLQSGREYTLTVQGTFTFVNAPLTVGTPNANAMFPTTEPGRITTQVGSDAETIFATVAGNTLGHISSFRWSLDGGGTFAHIEPVGGPFATPQTNYFYTYNVNGQGHALQAQIFDQPGQYSDNYGELLVTVQTVGGGSSGGGGGSLLPDPSQEPDGAWLRTSSGTAVWEPTPQVTEADISLSNVATLDVSTARHGFAPKAPNDATKFLDGTGAYSVPSGSGTISDITSSGATITVSSPTGPITNVDLPSSGATPGSYGDGSHVPQVTVDTQGRITAISTTGVTGGTGTIGYEISYTQITAGVNVVSTTEASGTTIISPGAVTFDGGPVLVEFWAPVIQTPTNIVDSAVTVCLFEGSTEITRLALAFTEQTSSTARLVPVYAVYRFTPSAGSHTYTVTAFASSTTGTPQVRAGAGGTGGIPPCFLRFTKV